MHAVAVLSEEAKSPTEWVEEINRGLPVSAAHELKAMLGITSEQLALLLGVSVRTLARWDPSRGRLDAVAGDRLYRVARLVSLANDVLEDGDAAVRWMKTPQPALAGGIPLDLSATDVGARAVEDLLGRMEHGVYT